MNKRLCDIRKELHIVSQGHTASPNSITVHLAFRLTQGEAITFVTRASKDNTSESLWARQAILEKLKEEATK